MHVAPSDDLRAAANGDFTPAQPPTAGAGSLYGAAAPFGSAAFARRDASDISPPSLKGAARPIPGWRASGSLWPAQRFAIRVPRGWNGRLVIAGCPGQRTEFACDLLFGDWLLERGYAYAAGNKGNGDGAAIVERGATLEVHGAALPAFPLPDGRGVAFWQHAPGHVMQQWPAEMIELVHAARDVVEQTAGAAPEFTYAIGLSNGGFQVRRAIEACDLFDGALVWNAVMWSVTHNPLDSLALAVDAMQAGEPERLEAIGFPPDVRSASGGSLYQKNLALYWYLTLWLHATQLDPETSLSYGDTRDPRPAQKWAARIGTWRSDRSPLIAERIRAFGNTGAINAKLIDVASEFDHLIPPRIHFEPYRAMVEAAGRADRYRGLLVPGAQHVDSWSEDPEYPGMRPGQPSVLQAWDDLVAWVEGAAVKSR